MKNLTVLVEPAEITRYVDAMWQTDMFKASSFVAGVVSEFARVPRIFADMTNPHLEKAHFSTWWNVIMRRTYDNPFVHDLYLLHEMYHAARMPYVPGIGKAAFDEKMQRNELEASVLSEIQVYFEMPGLREKSFSHPIYADRFLDDDRMVALWKADPVVAIETIRTIRRDVMVSKPVEAMDLTETWIRRFADQNAVFTITWADRYDEIEQKMAEFQFAATANRTKAINDYVVWLQEEAGKDSLDHIPFRQEAEIFSAHYWANAARYERAVAGERMNRLAFAFDNVMRANRKDNPNRNEDVNRTAEQLFQVLMADFAKLPDHDTRQEIRDAVQKLAATKTVQALDGLPDMVISIAVVRYLLAYGRAPIRQQTDRRAGSPSFMKFADFVKPYAIDDEALPRVRTA